MAFINNFTMITEIGDIEIDVTLDEEHRFDSMITENPVEDGTVTNDHVVLKPVVLNISGRVTDASLVILGVPKINGAKEAYGELVTLQLQRTPFIVSTGIKVYKNMLLESISFPRDGRDGKSIRFSAVLRELFIIGKNVTDNRTSIQEDVLHSAGKIIDRGVVSKVPVP